MLGDDEWVCVDCDLRQVELVGTCPACGGVVVSKHELEDSDYDPLIGRKLGGRFTIVARLGAGSMGAVYRARQDGMAREVALKVLKPERAFDTGAKARFEREARATSALTSPHTVTVYDFGEDETTPQGPLLYLAMERLHGESLGSRLKRLGRVPVPEAVKIAQQTLRSLAEAHDKGVVHRDLKPDNIYLHKVPTPHGMEEIVKVLDFGIAKIVQPDLKVDSLETQAGTVFGTPRYMSPEQAQSKPLDGRSDLYTVGLILFQMVTGRHVFPDEDAVVVMARHIQSLPPRPREVAPDAGISRRLEAIILRSLAKDPRRRPQNAQEFHDELETALHDHAEPSESAVVPVSQVAASPSINPVSDPSIEVTAAPTSARRRKMHVAVLFALFSVLLVGAVGLGVFLAQRRAPQPTIISEEPTRPTAAAANPETTTTAKPVETASPETTAQSAPKPAAPATTAAATKPKSGAASKATATAKTDAPPPPPEPPATAAPPPPPPATTTAPATSAKPPKKGSYGKFD